ncbi:MAG: alpha/beta fold hydrolase [Nitrospirae bacterium]|nr:alpha/beta fold hydrolase [Nitrospirota bacterium]
MDTIYYEGPEKAGNSHLIVFLPGRGDRLGTYMKHGFIDAIRQKGLNVDMAEADAYEAYYQDGSIGVRLREDIIGPAKAKGYKHIWLVGISMGGTGALLYASKYPDDISGVIAFSPFLGDEEIIGKIKNADGVQNWNPGRITEDDWQDFLWLWIKNYETEKSLPVYLGYGDHDRFAPVNNIFATALPRDHVVVINGAHDWQTWETLWGIFIEKLRPEINPKD